MKNVDTGSEYGIYRAVLATVLKELRTSRGKVLYLSCNKLVKRLRKSLKATRVTSQLVSDILPEVLRDLAKSGEIAGFEIEIRQRVRRYIVYKR